MVPISAAHFLAEHPLASIFGTVLVHQLGVPVPAFALLLWVGSAALDDAQLALSAFVVSVIAGTAGKLPWYWAGRRYGHRILRLACRVTLSPDSCVQRTLAKVARDQEVIVYCACPNEATAAKVALQLRGQGFGHVRPLAGGIDAWVSAGLAVELIG
jgi:rhodanese-related sulfurtransferase